MRKLLRSAWKLFASRPILWLPVFAVELIDTLLHRGERVWMRWGFEHWNTGRSVLGGDVRVSFDVVERRVRTVSFFLTQFRHFFVAILWLLALALVAQQVRQIVAGEPASLRAAWLVCRARVGRLALLAILRRVLEIGVYAAVTGAFLIPGFSGGLSRGLAIWPVASLLGIAVYGGVLWFLFPMMVACFRRTGEPPLANQGRKAAILLVVSSSLLLLFLEKLLSLGEARLGVATYSAVQAAGALHTLLSASVDVFVYIALALIALPEENSPGFEGLETATDRLAAWFRGVRRWPEPPEA